MAGILANSATETMVAADTSADNSVSGYLTGEQISLSTFPVGSVYSWTLNKASGSTARSDINDVTLPGPSFTPDVGGYYTVNVDVDGTSYVLRINVTQLAQSTTVEALRVSPKVEAGVGTPALGEAIFFSKDSGLLVAKNTAANVIGFDQRLTGALLTDAAATIQIGEGNVRVLPASTLTAARVLTLGTTSAVAGDTIDVVRFDAAAFTYAVANGGPGAGTLYTFASGEAGIAVSFRFDGTNWALWERRAVA